MLIHTKAIVLNTIKFGENSLIVKCFTQTNGAMSYMLKGILSSKKGKIKPAYFQPLSQLGLVTNHNKSGRLNYIKEVRLLNHYSTVYNDIIKQTIALFLVEVLSFAVQEEEENNELYQYLETAFIWLDTHNNTSNFHLLFLLNLTKYLGFYPELEHSDKMYFDLLEGCFTESPINKDYIGGRQLNLFKSLLGTNFDELETIILNGNERQNLLSIFMQYYELHLNGFRKPKSLDILKSIFH